MLNPYALMTNQYWRAFKEKLRAKYFMVELTIYKSSLGHRRTCTNSQLSHYITTSTTKNLLYSILLKIPLITQ